MKIINLSKHNIRSLNTEITVKDSLGIAGLSGSGKTTFCNAISAEYKRRIISLLPKADRDFLFKQLIKTDYGTLNISDLPPIKFFHQDGVIFSPRSTIGTHTGIFKSFRKIFAAKYNLSTQFFSYNNLAENNADLVCDKCKGRGTFAGATCAKCHGTRYTDKIHDYFIVIDEKKYSLLDLFQASIASLITIMDKLDISSKDKLLLNAFNALELEYLSLDRTFGTLSGGEITRIQLAEAISTSSHNLIVVDELSHGLDHQTLENVLKVVSHLGKDNVIWFIDHSDFVLNATAGKLFFGPESGSKGGEIVKKSPRPQAVFPSSPYLTAKNFIDFKDLHCRNINIDFLRLPERCIIGISGKSGCGKSTLMRNCILPYLSQNHTSFKSLVVEQNKAKMITKMSTLATFLGLATTIAQKAKISKSICHFCSGSGLNENAGICEYCAGTGIDGNYFSAVYAKNVTVENLYNLTIAELLDKLDDKDPIYAILKDIHFLGISHLSLSRSVRTLSAGEYQALYLVSCLNSLQAGKKYFLFLDEPTKGLSQNIINSLMIFLRKLQTAFDITIVYIEHTPYMLEAADYVIDFGSARMDNVSSLVCQSHSEWMQHISQASSREPHINCHYKFESGIKKINDFSEGNIEFDKAKNQFYGTIRNFSDTANWIYSSFSVERDEPIIAIDFASTLYSTGSRLWEVGNIISQLVAQMAANFKQAEFFDFRNPLNYCLSCKGTGKIQSIDFQKCFISIHDTWNSGLIEKDVYAALRNYNFSRVSKMFQALKKIRKLDFSKPFSAMSEEEKMTFMYGDWNYQLPGKEDRTYIWRGFNFLIQKYMKESKSPMKQILKDSLHEMTCPVCHGRTLRHRESLMFNDKDIFEYLTMPLVDVLADFTSIPYLEDIINIVGDQAALSNDISAMNKGIQCLCKLLDIYAAKTCGFSIYLKNLPECLPSFAEDWLYSIASRNHVIICSTMKNNIVSLAKLFPKVKCSENTPIFQLLGFKNIDKELRTMKKAYPCPACKGKGVFVVTSDNDDINNLSEPCSQCRGSGISSKMHQELIAGIEVENWLTGNLHGILPNKFPEGIFIPVLKKISDMDQGQLETLSFYMN